MDFTFRVRNFASFDDTGDIRISGGINVFVGVNNAGKTALMWCLAALSGPGSSNRNFPHLLRNHAAGYLRQGKECEVKVSYEVPRAECAHVFGTLFKAFDGYLEQPASTREFLEWTLVLESDGLLLKSLDHMRLIFDDATRHVLVPPSGEARQFRLENPFSKRSINTKVGVFGIDKAGANTYKLGGNVGQIWPKFFTSAALTIAHRNPPARQVFQYADELAADGSNLVQVLATAQLSTARMPDSRDRFEKLQEYVRRLFPEIKAIRLESIAPPNPGVNQEVECKLDLVRGETTSLSNSGTGVQQVLCLLTAAVFAKGPSLFLIDEPHSHLHPSAERGIVRVLEQIAVDQSHTFCISTHSPIFSSHARERIFAVIQTSRGSHVKRPAETQEILALLGVKNADLFTFDQVLFVEGPSDKAVMLALLSYYDRNHEWPRVKIEELDGDGEFRTRRREKLLQLLFAANTSEARVPIRFLFDSHGWTDQQRSDIRKMAESHRSTVSFLEKAELENYLLDPGAISAVLNSELKLSSGRAAAVDELKSLLVCRDDEKGSDVLARVFKAYDVHFQKNVHAPIIAAGILKKNADVLKPLYDELVAVLKGESAKAVAH